MSKNTSMSMNTCLKNARIFDEEFWDSDNKNVQLKIKQEPLDPEDAQFDSLTVSRVEQERNIKTRTNFKLEPVEQEEIVNNEQKLHSHIKQEFDDSPDRGEPKKYNEISILKRGMPYLKREASDMSEFSSTSSSSKETNSKRQKLEFESDTQMLIRRQKQIDYGKNTVGYDNYIKTIPRNKRAPGDPVTPNKYLKYSRRAWDGLIKQWRLRLHKYDST